MKAGVPESGIVRPRSCCIHAKGQSSLVRNVRRCSLLDEELHASGVSPSSAGSMQQCVSKVVLSVDVGSFIEHEFDGSLVSLPQGVVGGLAN